MKDHSIHKNILLFTVGSLLALHIPFATSQKIETQTSLITEDL